MGHVLHLGAFENLPESDLPRCSVLLSLKSMSKLSLKLVQDQPLNKSLADPGIKLGWSSGSKKTDSLDKWCLMLYLASCTLGRDIC